MPDTFYPLGSFDPVIVKELENRRNDRPSTDKSYSPKMGWARVTSLAQVTFKGKPTKVGFILNSNVGFNEIYGFGLKNESGILGFSSDGETPHRLSDVGLIDLKRPSPGVINIESELYSGEGKFVKAMFKFKCYDQFQFQYLTPFFLTPGVTVCLEWGWAKNIPPSLLPVNDLQELVKYRDDWNLEQKRRLNSHGNYELIMGMITGYDFNLQPDGSYECSVEVKSIGYSIYGLANTNETVLSEETLEVRKKASERISDIIDTYLNDGVNLDSGGSSYGFSAGILRKRQPKSNPNISAADGWISFGLFIKLMNREKVFRFQTGNESDAFKINIENSWISANPNMKSTNGKVLLIPNPFAPAWEIKGDNIDEIKGTLYTTSFQENLRFKEANIALAKMNKSFREDPGGYTGNSKNRVDLSAIISDGIDDGEPICFPNKDDPYYGHIKNLFIHKELISESLTNSHLTIQGLYDILKKISAAAGNIWNFEIVSNPNNKMQVSIIDTNFPGYDSEGNPINIDILKDSDKFYTFSSMDSNSILRGIDFSVKLSDAVGTQIMMDASDSNVSRDDDKFYQVLFADEEGDSNVTKIVDVLSKLKAKSDSVEETQLNKDTESEKEKASQDRNDPKINSEAPSSIQPMNDEYYFPVEMNVNGKSFTVRLVEPNDEIVRSSMSNDDSPFNSVRFNGLVQGITVNLTLTGISGLKYFDVFDIDNLPYPYNPNAIFQIINIKHSWSNNDWITNIEAMIRPRPSMFLKNADSQ
jgi:hypothetical protein